MKESRYRYGYKTGVSVLLSRVSSTQASIKQSTNVRTYPNQLHGKDSRTSYRPAKQPIRNISQTSLDCRPLTIIYTQTHPPQCQRLPNPSSPPSPASSVRPLPSSCSPSVLHSPHYAKSRSESHTNSKPSLCILLHIRRGLERGRCHGHGAHTVAESACECEECVERGRDRTGGIGGEGLGVLDVARGLEWFGVLGLWERVCMVGVWEILGSISCTDFLIVNINDYSKL